MARSLYPGPPTALARPRRCVHATIIAKAETPRVRLGAIVALVLAAAQVMAMPPPSDTLRVLVTGASGYLGQFLLDDIVKRGNVVGGRPLKVAGTYTSRHSIPEDVEAVPLDLQDAVSVERCVEAFRPDVVINLAALSSPAACEKSPAEAEALNAPKLLLSALEKTSPHSLFIHVSTDQIFDGNNAVYSEDSETHPVNTYGATKLMFEQELRHRWSNHVILRSSLIYGPAPPRACSRKDTFLQFLDAALAKEAPTALFADEVRCPIYVHDVTAIILSFLAPDAFRVCVAASDSDALPRGSRTFNMGGPERLSRVQMGEIVCQVRGYPSTRIRHSSRAELDLGFTSPLDISMNSSKLMDRTAWVKDALAAIHGSRDAGPASFHAVAVKLLR